MDTGLKNVFVKNDCRTCIHKEVCSKRQTYEKAINEIKSQGYKYKEVEIDVRCKYYRDNILDITKRTVVEKKDETIKLKPIPMPTYESSMNIDCEGSKFIQDEPAFVADESKDGSCSSRKRMEHF